jgi:hypothetical protein
MRRRRLLAYSLLATGLVGCGPGSRGTARAARAPLGPPRVFAGELDARALLGDLPSRASRLGAGAPSLVAAGEAAEQERLGGFVEVPADVCLLAYARAASSIEDVDIMVYGDDGNTVASDEANDPHPTLLFCPPHPDRVYVSMRVASGEGLVALAAQLVPPERALEVARAVGARGSHGAGSRAADAWPGLDDHVRAHRDALGGKWEEFRKVAVALDARAASFVALPLEADACTDVVIIPDDDVALIEVEALDADGRVLARARDGSRDRTLVLCSPIALNGSLSMRPHVGQGLAAVVLARARGEVARDLSARPEIAWAAVTHPLEATRNARNSELAKAGYGAAAATTTGNLVIGRRSLVSLEVPPLGCSRVDVVAGAPLALIDAAVWDDAGSLVSTGDGVGSVVLYACARGKARLELEARGRPGPFATLVRPERWKDPAFTLHPLAASRMLARAVVGPSQLLEGAPSGVRSVALDATRMATWDELIPAGKCLRVAAGAQGDGTGLDLRIVDRASADELDRSHAERAVGARACAPQSAPRAVRVELRATSGKLDAVVGERILG